MPIIYYSIDFFSKMGNVVLKVTFSLSDDADLTFFKNIGSAEIIMITKKISDF